MLAVYDLSYFYTSFSAPLCRLLTVLLLVLLLVPYCDDDVLLESCEVVVLITVR